MESMFGIGMEIDEDEFLWLCKEFEILRVESRTRLFEGNPNYKRKERANEKHNKERVN